jgi:hypothetical protein
MTRRIRPSRWTSPKVCGVVVLLLGVFAVSGTAVAAVRSIAGLETPPDVSSTSNPYDWRGGWGNTLTPDFRLGFASGTTGFYYTVDQYPRTLSTATVSLENYNHSLSPNGTLFGQTVDVPHDGIWYMNVLSYELVGPDTEWVPPATVNIPFGVDRVPPSMPTGIRVTKSAPQPTDRMTISWDGKEYDSLSHTAYFSIYIDGIRAVSYRNAVVSVEPSTPPVWFRPDIPWGNYSFTVEDVPAGWHSVYVTATDFAGNESAPGVAYIYNAAGYSGASTDVRPSILRSVKDSPDPFYPRKRDGYKDNTFMRFKLTTSANVRMRVYDSTGLLIRDTGQKHLRAGWRSLKWDGRNSVGRVVPAGVYYMYVYATDHSKRCFIAAKSSTVRSYYLRRLSRGRVRVVFS